MEFLEGQIIRESMRKKRVITIEWLIYTLLKDLLILN